MQMILSRVGKQANCSHRCQASTHVDSCPKNLSTLANQYPWRPYYMTLQHIFTIFMIQTFGTAQRDHKIQGGSTYRNNQVLINDGSTWIYRYTGYTYIYICMFIEPGYQQFNLVTSLGSLKLGSFQIGVENLSVLRNNKLCRVLIYMSMVTTYILEVSKWYIWLNCVCISRILSIQLLWPLQPLIDFPPAEFTWKFICCSARHCCSPEAFWSEGWPHIFWGESHVGPTSTSAVDIVINLGAQRLWKALRLRLFRSFSQVLRISPA